VLKNVLIIAFLLLVTIFFRTYKLDKFYSFEWDQERDSIVINSIIQDKKPVLIGPRVINDKGFFTGPYHYYYLLPFYILFDGNPIAGAYAALLVELVTLVAIYIVCLKIFGIKVAVFSSLMYSVIFGLMSWNAMYISLFSIVIFYLCYLIINNNNRVFPLLIALFTLGFNIHPSLFALIIPIVVAYLYSSKKVKLRTFLISILYFVIILSPLLFFDLRHDFLNFKGFYNFIFGSKTINFAPFLFLRSYWRGINLFATHDVLFLVIERILIILFGLIGLITIKDKKLKILMSVWVFHPLLLLSFYRGDIPEYYYSSSLILLTVLVGIVCAKVIPSKLIPIIVVVVVVGQYLSIIKSNYVGGLSLKNKIDVVSYIVNQKRDTQFNVSYDLPLGMNSGYKYLFKYLGKEPTDTPDSHLYSIVLLDKSAKTDDIVYRDQILGVVRR